MEVKKKIRQMLDSGRSDIAKLLIREYDRQVPGDPEIRLWRSVIAVQEGKLDDAQALLVETLGYEHRDFEAAFLLADVYRRKRELPAAAGLYRLAESLAPGEREREETARAHGEIAAALEAEERPQPGDCPDYAYPDAPNPLVSIVVLGYNHSFHTKMCIESVYRHTANIPFELITVDNGSTDDSGPYFQSLPNRKKITLHPNQGPVGGFNAGMLAAEGAYTACISNDFIMTEGWLDNLLRCIESDPSIGFVSPGANIVSNHQQIIGDYTTVEEMHRFAKEYNVSDPAKWEERLQLMPCVLMTRTEALRKAGYFDPRFRYGEFADDDISFRIRRAGYKLVLARDTFTYHFGSVTGREDQIKAKSLETSRTVFRGKYGIDAWSEARFDPALVQSVMDLIPADPPGNGRLRVLGVNTGCGGTTLQLRNALRSAGCGHADIVSYTDQARFMTDLATVSAQAVHGPLDDLANRLPHESFDIVILGDGWARCSSPAALIASIRSLLKRSGRFACKIQNQAHYLSLFRLLSDRPIGEGDDFAQPDRPPKLAQLLELLHIGKLPATKLFHVSSGIVPALDDFYRALQAISAPYGLNADMLPITDTIVTATAD